MNNKSKLGRLASLGLAGILAVAGFGNSGCTNYSREYCEANGIDYDQQMETQRRAAELIWGLNLGMMAGSPDINANPMQRRVMSDVGSGLVNNALREDECAGGAPQVTINYQQPTQIIRRDPIAVSCNSWIDSNGDGNMDTTELIGVKSIFRRDEQIMIVGYLWNPTPTSYKYIIENLDSHEILGVSNNFADLSCRIYRVTNNPYCYSIGRYRATFDLGDKSASCEFRVIDRE